MKSSLIQSIHIAVKPHREGLLKALRATFRSNEESQPSSLVYRLVKSPEAIVALRFLIPREAVEAVSLLLFQETPRTDRNPSISFALEVFEVLSSLTNQELTSLHLDWLAQQFTTIQDGSSFGIKLDENSETLAVLLVIIVAIVTPVHLPSIENSQYQMHLHFEASPLFSRSPPLSSSSPKKRQGNSSKSPKKAAKSPVKLTKTGFESRHTFKVMEVALVGASQTPSLISSYLDFLIKELHCFPPVAELGDDLSLWKEISIDEALISLWKTATPEAKQKIALVLLKLTVKLGKLSAFFDAMETIGLMEFFSFLDDERVEDALDWEFQPLLIPALPLNVSKEVSFDEEVISPVLSPKGKTWFAISDRRIVKVDEKGKKSISKEEVSVNSFLAVNDQLLFLIQTKPLGIFQYGLETLEEDHKKNEMTERVIHEVFEYTHEVLLQCKTEPVLVGVASSSSGFALVFSNLRQPGQDENNSLELIYIEKSKTERVQIEMGEIKPQILEKGVSVSFLKGSSVLVSLESGKYAWICSVDGSEVLEQKEITMPFKEMPENSSVLGILEGKTIVAMTNSSKGKIKLHGGCDDGLRVTSPTNENQISQFNAMKHQEKETSPLGLYISFIRGLRNLHTINTKMFKGEISLSSDFPRILEMIKGSKNQEEAQILLELLLEHNDSLFSICQGLFETLSGSELAYSALCKTLPKKLSICSPETMIELTTQALRPESPKELKEILAGRILQSHQIWSFFDQMSRLKGENVLSLFKLLLENASGPKETRIGKTNENQRRTVEVIEELHSVLVGFLVNSELSKAPKGFVFGLSQICNEFDQKIRENCSRKDIGLFLMNSIAKSILLKTQSQVAVTNFMRIPKAIIEEIGKEHQFGLIKLATSFERDSGKTEEGFEMKRVIRVLPSSLYEKEEANDSAFFQWIPKEKEASLSSSVSDLNGITLEATNAGCFSDFLILDLIFWNESSRTLESLSSSSQIPKILLSTPRALHNELFSSLLTENGQELRHQSLLSLFEEAEAILNPMQRVGGPVANSLSQVLSCACLNLSGLLPFVISALEENPKELPEKFGEHFKRIFKKSSEIRTTVSSFLSHGDPLKQKKKIRDLFNRALFIGESFEASNTDFSQWIDSIVSFVKRDESIAVSESLICFYKSLEQNGLLGLLLSLSESLSPENLSLVSRVIFAFLKSQDAQDGSKSQAVKEVLMKLKEFLGKRNRPKGTDSSLLPSLCRLVEWKEFFNEAKKPLFEFLKHLDRVDCFHLEIVKKLLEKARNEEDFQMLSGAINHFAQKILEENPKGAEKTIGLILKKTSEVFELKSKKPTEIIEEKPVAENLDQLELLLKRKKTRLICLESPFPVPQDKGEIIKTKDGSLYQISLSQGELRVTKRDPTQMTVPSLIDESPIELSLSFLKSFVELVRQVFLTNSFSDSSSLKGQKELIRYFSMLTQASWVFASSEEAEKELTKLSEALFEGLSFEVLVDAPLSVLVNACEVLLDFQSFEKFEGKGKAKFKISSFGIEGNKQRVTLDLIEAEPSDIFQIILTQLDGISQETSVSPLICVLQALTASFLSDCLVGFTHHHQKHGKHPNTTLELRTFTRWFFSWGSHTAFHEGRLLLKSIESYKTHEAFETIPKLDLMVSLAKGVDIELENYIKKGVICSLDRKTIKIMMSFLKKIPSVKALDLLEKDLYQGEYSPIKNDLILLHEVALQEYDRKFKENEADGFKQTEELLFWLNSWSYSNSWKELQEDETFIAKKEKPIEEIKERMFRPLVGCSFLEEVVDFNKEDLDNFFFNKEIFKVLWESQVYGRKMILNKMDRGQEVIDWDYQGREKPQRVIGYIQEIQFGEQKNSFKLFEEEPRNQELKEVTSLIKTKNVVLDISRVVESLNGEFGGTGWESRVQKFSVQAFWERQIKGLVFEFQLGTNGPVHFWEKPLRLRS